MVYGEINIVPLQGLLSVHCASIAGSCVGGGHWIQSLNIRRHSFPDSQKIGIASSYDESYYNVFFLCYSGRELVKREDTSSYDEFYNVFFLHYSGRELVKLVLRPVRRVHQQHLRSTLE